MHTYIHKYRHTYIHTLVYALIPSYINKLIYSYTHTFTHSYFFSFSTRVCKMNRMLLNHIIISHIQLAGPGYLMTTPSLSTSRLHLDQKRLLLAKKQPRTRRSIHCKTRLSSENESLLLLNMIQYLHHQPQ